MPSHWKSAVDPRSGQTYYFHEITRETQWRKPMELATSEEKSAMEVKEQKEKDFFAAMEANILSSLSRGVIPGTPAQDRSPIQEEDSEVTSERPRKMSLRKRRSRAGRPEMVRTISTMDESVLRDVIHRQPSFRSVKSGSSFKSVKSGFSSREPSLQVEDLRQYVGSISSHDRDSFDSLCSSSHGSQSSFLETLEEDVCELNSSVKLDSTPDLRSSLRERATSLSRDNDVESLEDNIRSIDQSIPARDDLNDEETQALNKLFSLTKEMMDVDKESSKDTVGEKIDQPTRTLQRATDGDVGRTLPRELDLEDSDGKKEKSSSQPKSRREKARRMLANSGKSAAELLRPGVQPARRNTCGTMYIKTTMSAPDKDATIRVS